MDMDITSKDIKRISDIAMMQSGIYMKSDPAGDIKYLQVKDINPRSKPDYSRITTVVDRGIGDQYRLRKNDLLFAAKGASNYNPQIEMFARFKMKSSFHKTKRII